MTDYREMQRLIEEVSELRWKRLRETEEPERLHRRVWRQPPAVVAESLPAGPLGIFGPGVMIYSTCRPWKRWGVLAWHRGDYWSMTREEASALVQQAIKEINSLRDADNTVPTDRNVRLTGPDGALDSMETVNLVTYLEASLERAVGSRVTIVTKNVLSGADPALESSDRLVEHIVALCGGAAH